ARTTQHVESNLHAARDAASGDDASRVHDSYAADSAGRCDFRKAVNRHFAERAGLEKIWFFSGREFRLGRFSRDPGDLEKVLIHRAVEFVFTRLAGEGGSSYVEQLRRDDLRVHVVVGLR